MSFLVPFFVERPHLLGLILSRRLYTNVLTHKYAAVVPVNFIRRQVDTNYVFAGHAFVMNELSKHLVPFQNSNRRLVWPLTKPPISCCCHAIHSRAQYDDYLCISRQLDIGN